MKINKAIDGVAGLETFDQWKEKVSELENSVGVVETKFKPEKDIKKIMMRSKLSLVTFR